MLIYSLVDSFVQLFSASVGWSVGEQQVLADERNDERRGRNDVGEQQEEDGQRQQDRDAQRDLLSAESTQQHAIQICLLLLLLLLPFRRPIQRNNISNLYSSATADTDRHRQTDKIQLTNTTNTKLKPKVVATGLEKNKIFEKIF